jgi:hypothetical protein
MASFRRIALIGKLNSREVETSLRELREFSPSDPYYFRLMTAHRQSAKTLISLATKLRLTPQSNRRAATDMRAPAQGLRPWEE